MSVSKEFVQSVRRRIAGQPGVITGQLAVELNASEAEVIIALPVAMRKKARPEDFEVIWAAMSGWRNVVIHPAGGAGEPGMMPGPVLSFGALCNGECSLDSQDVLGDRRVFTERLGSIWFVSLPLFGRQSHSVRFYDSRGEHMLSVFLGRDRQGGHDRQSLTEFGALRERHGVTPVPRNRCKGCPGCTCADKPGRAH